MSPPGLGWGPVTRCFVHCDEPPASIDVLKFVEQLTGYQLRHNCFTPWGLVVEDRT